MTRKLTKNELKRPLKDLRNIENDLFRALLTQAVLSSEFKRICFKNGIINLERNLFSILNLKWLGNQLTNSEDRLRMLAVMLMNMQPTDIFNFVMIDYQKADYVARYLILRLHCEIWKLKKSPFKIAYFRLKVIFEIKLISRLLINQFLKRLWNTRTIKPFNQFWTWWK